MTDKSKAQMITAAVVISALILSGLMLLLVKAMPTPQLAQSNATATEQVASTDKAAPAADHHDQDKAKQVQGPADGAIDIELGDIWIESSETELAAGTYELNVHNSGAMPHMLDIELTPVALEAGVPTGANSLVHVDLGPGEKATETVTLEAGTYEFYCNVSGHYQAGQTMTVTVN
jgi:uncharacterized cupredoxin-like copper-binding protein